MNKNSLNFNKGNGAEEIHRVKYSESIIKPSEFTPRIVNN